MINLNAYENLVPGPFFSKNTIFYQLDVAAFNQGENNFDIEFIDHIQYGPIRDVVIVETLWIENDTAEVILQFSWDCWSFQLTAILYGVFHECPSCRCMESKNLYEPIVEALNNLCWDYGIHER